MMETPPSPFSILTASRMSSSPLPCLLLLLLLPGPVRPLPVLRSAADDGGAVNTSAGQNRRLFFSLTRDAAEKALLDLQAAAAAAVAAAPATGRVCAFALAVAAALLAALKNDMVAPRSGRPEVRWGCSLYVCSCQLLWGECANEDTTTEQKKKRSIQTTAVELGWMLLYRTGLV